MPDFQRYAVYYLPPPGALATFGAAWLGWDVETGMAPSADAPDVPDWASLTEAPRKYGFHGTLKPPFRLAAGADPGALRTAIAALAQELSPAQCAGLRLAALGRFLALVPDGDATTVGTVATACVTQLDQFRAPLTEAELARRRARPLSAQQEMLLQRWGYPHVCEAFRFHMTLTGRVPKQDLPMVTDHVARHLPALPQPFVLDQISLVGERTDGRFESIERFPLCGPIEAGVTVPGTE